MPRVCPPVAAAGAAAAAPAAADAGADHAPAVAISMDALVVAALLTRLNTSEGAHPAQQAPPSAA